MREQELSLFFFTIVQIIYPSIWDHSRKAGEYIEANVFEVIKKMRQENDGIMYVEIGTTVYTQSVVYVPTVIYIYIHI